MISKYQVWSRTLERNIINVLSRATEADRTDGIKWYRQAHNDARTLARVHGITVAKACGVIAALSPGNEFGRNVLEASEVIEAYVAGKPLPMVGVYGKRNIDKCRMILDGKKPSVVLSRETAPKTHSFYRLINDPTNDFWVCIDRHAKGVAENVRGNRNTIVRSFQYDWYAW